VLLVASQAAARQSHHPDIKTCCYKLRHPTRYMPILKALLYTFCLQEQMLLALYEESAPELVLLVAAHTPLLDPPLTFRSCTLSYCRLRFL
jgi:hypothetical protein